MFPSRSMLVVFAALAACATLPSTVELSNTGPAEAAQGQIEVSADRNENLQRDVVVQHLAPPQKIDRAAHFYVVRVEPGPNPGRQAPVPLGQLEVKADLTGALSATTPFPTARVFITAERRIQASRPTGTEVLGAVVMRQ